MKPTELLKEEHHGVKLALRVLGKLCAKIEENPREQSAIYSDDFTRLIEFLRVFVDKCHHAKEEEVLFPAVVEAGASQAEGLVQELLAEHVSGRKLVADMEAALTSYRSGNPDAIPALTGAAGSYAKLLTEHINQEDNVLYLIADAKIADGIQAEMIETFEKIETERIGIGTHDQFHDMLKEFKLKYLK